MVGYGHVSFKIYLMDRLPNLLRYGALGSTTRSVLVFSYSYGTC